MNATSRRAINAALDLPSGYRGVADYGEFIDCVRHIETLGTLQVLRIVGPKRCLVMFVYERGASRHSVHRNNRLMYLMADGNLSEFNAKRIYAEAREDARDKCNMSWERVIGTWLEDNDAMTFAGRGWAERCAKEIDKLVGWWEDRYDPTLPKREGEL